MSVVTNNRILRITRLLVHLIMSLIAVAGVVLALVSMILTFFWQEAAQEIAKQNALMDTQALLPKLYAIFALGILTLGLVWTIMRKLLAIIDSVAAGHPFVTANALRLKAIGWSMIGVQIVGIPLAMTAGEAADLFGENNVNFELSINGILAILLVFILAGIFERGAEMREELEGMV